MHLLIIYLFFSHRDKVEIKKNKTDDKPINLNLSTFEPSQKKIEPKPKKIVKKKPIKKPKPKKKITKKKPEPKKETKKIEKKVEKKVIKKSEPKKIVSKPKSFEESLMNMGRALHPTPQPQNNPMIDRLYGSEFKSYTPKQKKFIKKNLETIHQITQRVLVMHGYPQEALDLFQEGVNVVSFYLHPNGTISNLQITQSSNSYFLDENTRQVIEMAYSQYPLPKQTTKIIFYVNYRIQ